MAIIVDGIYKHLVLDVRAINDQIAVTLSVISIIRAYISTSTASDEEIEEFYSFFEETPAS